MSKEHKWGDPDEAGVRACVNEGCTVRLRSRFGFLTWQPKHGWLWRSGAREPVPDCYGKEQT